MNVATHVPAGALGAARPRSRGLTVLSATLYETRSLVGAACGYIVIIGVGGETVTTTTEQPAARPIPPPASALLGCAR